MKTYIHQNGFQDPVQAITAAEAAMLFSLQIAPTDRQGKITAQIRCTFQHHPGSNLMAHSYEIEWRKKVGSVMPLRTHLVFREQPEARRAGEPKVTAIFTEQDTANHYMETHTNQGLLAEENGLIYLADIQDLGDLASHRQKTNKQ